MCVCVSVHVKLVHAPLGAHISMLAPLSSEGWREGEREREGGRERERENISS